jgi:hypothetical protein
VTADLSDFVRFHLPALEADEVRFNIQIAARLSRRGRRRCHCPLVCRARNSDGVKFDAPIPQRVYVLTSPPRYPSASGSARAVSAADAPLLFEWSGPARSHAPERECPESRRQWTLSILDRARRARVRRGNQPPPASYGGDWRAGVESSSRPHHHQNSFFGTRWEVILQL